MTHEPPASVELAPCPFCQSADVSISFSATTTSPDPAARFVECEDCAAMGPSFKIEDGNDAGAQTKAITAWNTRASTPPARPGRESIEDIVREAQFLCDRLDSLEWADDGYADVQREYFGHVEPSHTRLKRLLALFDGAET